MHRGWVGSACFGVCLLLMSGCYNAAPKSASGASAEAHIRFWPRFTRLSGLRVPATYVQTCRLEPQMCFATSGHVPRSMLRPLRLPRPRPNEPCPADHGRLTSDFAPYGGVALGRGPVYANVAIGRARPVRNGVMLLRPSYRQGRWYAIKTMWIAAPSYRGPILIRGRQLNGPHPLGLGDQAPPLAGLQLPPHTSTNSTKSWRDYPGAAWLRSAGCYGWQVDGTNFSETIVFRARKPK